MEQPEGQGATGLLSPADMYIGLIHRLSPSADDLLHRHAESGRPSLSRRPMSVLAHALTQAVLVAATGLEEWTFEQTASGALIVKARAGSRAPSISLSHSGDWAACAVSFSGEVGIDVELHKPSRDFVGIAQYAFGIDEQETVARLGAEGFYAIWTLREAIAKATREGLRQVTDSVDRVPGGPFHGSCRSTFGGEDWWLMHECPTAGLSLAVALRFGGAIAVPVNVRRWPDAQ